MQKFYGMYLGICVSRMDPEFRGRVKVFIPEISPLLYDRWNEDGKNITLTCAGNNVMYSLTTEMRNKLERILPFAEAASPVMGSSAPGFFNNATGGYAQTADNGQQSPTSNPDINATSPAGTPAGDVQGGVKPSSEMNGKLDRNNPQQLVQLGDYVKGAGKHQRYLHPSVEAAFKKCCEAYKQETGKTFTITDAYRDFNEQVACAQKKGVYGQGGLCAVPGRSNHGLGCALDIGDSEQGWMARNGARFGFNTIPKEPWHWEIKPNKISPEGFSHTASNTSNSTDSRANTGENKPT
jgi:hypothetical protein